LVLYKRLVNGQLAKITEYRGAKDLDVQFEDKTVVTHKTWRNFCEGSIANPTTLKSNANTKYGNKNCSPVTTNYTIELTFGFHDNYEDSVLANITVPSNLSKDDVMRILQETHASLDRDYSDAFEESIYGTQGREPEVLLEYVCQKYGWNWELEEPDIELCL